MRYVSYTTKGLEEITLHELQKNLGEISIIKKSDKIIIFDFEGKLDKLENLKTVDDIGLYVGDLQNLNLLNLPKILEKLEAFRKTERTFSITTSIIQASENKDELVNSVIREITKQGLNYSLYNRSNLDFRIFLNKDIGFLAIRLMREPLSKRPYECDNYLGALKPTIAAAMVQIAAEQLLLNSKIVDNFCGSGTILCEALDKGFQVYGGDINSEAVRLTQKRLSILGNKQKENIKLQDATKTKWNANYFDCAISNLPWDKQHEISHITKLYSDTVKEYKRILKPSFRLCIICHKPELLTKNIKKEFGEVDIKQTSIGYLGQNPTIVLATSS